MGIVKQYSRISHHTLTGGITSPPTSPAVSFTVPPSEDFTDGSWTIYDLAQSEIGILEDTGEMFVRIGSEIKQVQLTDGGGSGSGSGVIINTDDVIVKWEDALGTTIREIILDTLGVTFQFDGTDKYTFPIGDGSANQVMVTDGLGQISWQDKIYERGTAGTSSIKPVDGAGNDATGDYSVVSGGINNTVSQDWAAIVSGDGNNVTGDYSFIGGGNNNQISGTTRSFIGGGADNLINGVSYIVIGGGFDNNSNQVYSFIGGGSLNSNTATGVGGTIGGGVDNSIAGTSNEGPTIAGGYSNSINTTGDYCTIGGGFTNTITTGTRSTISGGFENTVTGSNSVIGGGYQNRS